jgi:hypothetical protein
MRFLREVNVCYGLPRPGSRKEENAGRSQSCAKASSTASGSAYGETACAFRRISLGSMVIPTGCKGGAGAREEKLRQGNITTLMQNAVNLVTGRFKGLHSWTASQLRDGSVSAA